MPDHVELRSPSGRGHVLESKYCKEEMKKVFNFILRGTELLLRNVNGTKEKKLSKCREVRQVEWKAKATEMRAPFFFFG